MAAPWPRGKPEPAVFTKQIGGQLPARRSEFSFAGKRPA